MNKLTNNVLFIVLIFLFSCEKGTEPGEQTKSVRDYTWSVDTLSVKGANQNLMYSIWGDKPNNLYTCGHFSGSGIEGNGNGTMWHFDGAEWYLEELRGDLIAGDLVDVHGKDANNVWSVGSYGIWHPTDRITKSQIIKFDGEKWTQHGGITDSKVFSIYVESQTNVWACGGNGIVYYYNGTAWDLDTLKIENEGQSYQLNDIIHIGGKTYVNGHHTIEEGNEYFFFIKNGNEPWQIKDTFIIPWTGGQEKWGRAALHKTSSGKLWSVGSDGLFEWTGSKWISKYLSGEFLAGIHEYSENNKIAVGQNSKVKHFNGSDWIDVVLHHNEGIVFRDVIQFKNEAFIVGQLLNQTPQITLVFHGK